MIKHTFLNILIVGLLLLSVTPTIQAAEIPTAIANQQHEKIDAKYNPKSMYQTTEQGQILYDYNGTQEIDPASTTKLMTVYVLMDEIKKGHLKMSDKVKMTKSHEQMTQLPDLTTFAVQANQTYTVEQLLKQALLESSNAATLILGEKVSGDTSKFTDLMNTKAKALGMTNTHFTNPSGANNQLIRQFTPTKYKHETFSHTTAQDMALLTHQLLAQYPEVLKYTALESDSQYGRPLHNTNLSLPHSPDHLVGVDGLKTGSSRNGYNLVLTAKQNGLRINTGIYNVQPFGDEVAKHARQKLANSVTKQAFNNYEYRKVISKGKHKINDTEYQVSKDLYDVVPKNKKAYHLKVENQQLKVDYKRQFIKGTHAPSVKATKIEPKQSILPWLIAPLALIGITGSFLYLALKK